MAFLIHSIANENVVPWEYFPCSDALIPGEVLAFKDGKMVSATADLLATKVPLYLSMCEKGAGEEEIPAIRIRDDMILEGPSVPPEDLDILEGDIAYMTSMAAFAGQELAGEIRRRSHASHVIIKTTLENEQNAQHVLFEVVGVLPPDPEAETSTLPKVLIRLIG